MKKYLKSEKGITLVALVITIVLLLILAGISISSLTNTGIFAKAKEAKEKSENAEKEQNEILDNYEKKVDQYLPAFTGTTVKEAIQHGRVLNATDNTELHDEKGSKIVVPAGFKVTGDATTVDKGIVIEDATTGATSGSQFVWIPVGKITKADGDQFVNKLERYDFDKTTGKESLYSGNFVEEDANDPSTLKNIEGKSIAKNITNFKNSVASNDGYYIGRYEARTTVKRNNENDSLKQITEKETDQVYNYVTQQQAAQQAQEMYKSNKFTSDLINSYAWDTAILFLQNCGTDPKYSIRNRGENKTLSQTGTTNDKQCNVYDMVGNLREWTTETSDNSDHPCVKRGGCYHYEYSYASYRNNDNTDGSYTNVGFRTLLYL